MRHFTDIDFPKARARDLCFELSSGLFYTVAVPPGEATPAVHHSSHEIR